LRLARLHSPTSNATAMAVETQCKSKAMRHIVETAVREEWADVVNICSELCIAATDADVGSVVETLLEVKSSPNGQFVVPAHVCLRTFQSAVARSCLKSLIVICRLGIPSRRLGTRQLVEKVREEASKGNSAIVFLLLASLSKEAVTSRRERDAMWARRRLDWERRGGLWGAMQEEEERNQGRTDEERDFDDAMGGALRRTGTEGHTTMLSSLLKMLRARGRLADFASDYEKAFEGACRGGHEQTVNELLSYVTVSEAAQMEGLTIAARNGHTGLARVLVMDSRLPLQTIRSKFLESARRGHLSAIQTILATGAIGASTCADALEEAMRREHEECIPVLQQAHARLLRFEEEEGSMIKQQQH